MKSKRELLLLICFCWFKQFRLVSLVTQLSLSPQSSIIVSIFLKFNQISRPDFSIHLDKTTGKRSHSSYGWSTANYKYSTLVATGIQEHQRMAISDMTINLLLGPMSLKKHQFAGKWEKERYRTEPRSVRWTDLSWVGRGNRQLRLISDHVLYVMFVHISFWSHFPHVFTFIV